MKCVALIGTAALAFSFAVALPAFAQEAGHEDAKPAESKPAESKPAESKPTAHNAPKQQEQKPDDARHDGDAKPQDRAENKPAAESKPAPAHNDAAHNDATHRDATRSTTRTTTTKTTTSIHRIPDEKYRANFGREHTFHVGHPEMVGGRAHFMYGGYGFYYAQPWPSGWGYDDDVYVIDIDGTYYLVNAVHPGVQLALIVDL